MRSLIANKSGGDSVFRQKQRQPCASEQSLLAESGRCDLVARRCANLPGRALKSILRNCLAAVLLVTLNACGPTQATTKLPRETLLTLTADGAVTVRPDEVVATAQVDTFGGDAVLAQRNNESLGKRLTQRLTDRGVRSDQIAITGPELREDGPSARRAVEARDAEEQADAQAGAALAGQGRNYRASSTVHIRTQIRYADALIEEISALGIFTRSAYRLHDDQNARNDARALAISRARATAQRIARASNLTVRRIVTIEDLASDPDDARLATDSVVPFEVRARIRIVFALK